MVMRVFAVIVLALMSLALGQAQPIVEGLPNVGAAGVNVLFVPQVNEYGMDRYSVIVCNTTNEASNFHSGVLRNEAVRHGLRPAGFVYLKERFSDISKRSTASYIISGGEAFGYVLTILASGNVILSEAHPAIKALPGMLSGAVRISVEIANRHRPAVTMPENILPTFINLPAGIGQCQEYTLYSIVEEKR